VHDEGGQKAPPVAENHRALHDWRNVDHAAATHQKGKAVAGATAVQGGLRLQL
jgi:hypothetical protein